MPRIFTDSKLSPGAKLKLTREQCHYLLHVMRTKKFLIFNDGNEHAAELTDDDGTFAVGTKTEHKDPSGNFAFYFAPIKKTEDLISAVTQMGAAILQPVITERTTARHINWTRMKKIVIEAAEQSGRNSVPELRSPITFKELDKKDLIFGNPTHEPRTTSHEPRKLFIGPEGGLSDDEINELEKSGAVGINLGATILRAETAAVALCAVMSQCVRFAHNSI